MENNKDASKLAFAKFIHIKSLNKYIQINKKSKQKFMANQNFIKAAKPVLIFNGACKLIAIARSARAANELMRGSEQGISFACSGKYISSNGFYFRHIPDDIEITLEDIGNLDLRDFDELCGVKREYYTTHELSKIKRTRSIDLKIKRTPHGKAKSEVENQIKEKSRSNRKSFKDENCEIKTFHHSTFGQIRATTYNGKTMFVANDITKALGYENPKKVINNICQLNNSLEYTSIYIPRKNSNGVTKATIIGEANVSRLIMSSKFYDTEIFHNWIVEEIIPAIKTTICKESDI